MYLLECTGSLRPPRFTREADLSRRGCVVNNNRLFSDSSLISLFICVQDEKLKALVQKLGTSDWKYIASYIPVSHFSPPGPRGVQC